MFIYSYCYVCSFLYSVSLCCSMYCLIVNVYSNTATGCHPNFSQQIYKFININIFSLQLRVHLNTSGHFTLLIVSV